MPSYDEGALVLFGRRKAASWSCCPWLEKQWHNDIDPEYGVGMGDYFEGFVDEEARALGLTHDAIRAWTPYSARLGESRPHGPSPRIQPTLGKLVRLLLAAEGILGSGIRRLVAVLDETVKVLYRSVSCSRACRGCTKARL